MQVLELKMDHVQMLVGKAEGFSIGKSFDCSQLVKENQVIVLDVEVDWVKILLKDDGVDHVDSSLFQAHIRDSAQDLEQVFENVFLGVLVKHLHFAS